MIVYALSNVAYRVSLRGPEAELQGAISRPPPLPSDRGKSRGAAERGLSAAVAAEAGGQRGHYAPPSFQSGGANISFCPRKIAIDIIPKD